MPGRGGKPSKGKEYRISRFWVIFPTVRPAWFSSKSLQEITTTGWIDGAPIFSQTITGLGEDYQR